jgi:hypothetical protein
MVGGIMLGGVLSVIERVVGVVRLVRGRLVGVSRLRGSDGITRVLFHTLPPGSSDVNKGVVLGGRLREAPLAQNYLVNGAVLIDDSECSSFLFFRSCEMHEAQAEPDDFRHGPALLLAQLLKLTVERFRDMNVDAVCGCASSPARLEMLGLRGERIDMVRGMSVFPRSVGSCIGRDDEIGIFH